jgi:hypothetical protein
MEAGYGAANDADPIAFFTVDLRYRRRSPRPVPSTRLSVLAGESHGSWERRSPCVSIIERLITRSIPSPFALVVLRNRHASSRIRRESSPSPGKRRLME